ncbi:tetracycline resistance protein s [Apiospora aurea]|uniref:Tetracycline resistance protein s n=1 Tax=Apiospora aurea TaxID=335848 RepID=A0ABR1QLY2_9PEZI
MASSFHPFPRLPMELQLMVWTEAVLADHHYVLIDAASHFNKGFRRAAMGITPTPNLRHALLEVNQASRTVALEHCSARLDVWERPPHMLEDGEPPAVGLRMPEEERRRVLRLYEAQDRAQELADRLLGWGEELTADELQLIYDALKPIAQQRVTDATNEYLLSAATGLSLYAPPSWPPEEAAFRYGLGEAFWWTGSARYSPWALVPRGVVYLDPERDYFVTLTHFNKAARDAFPCDPLRRAQRFIALSRADFPCSGSGGGNNNSTPNTTTLYRAAAASRALTPPTSLRRLARRGLEIRPDFPLPRDFDGAEEALPYTENYPFRSAAHAADWFHDTLSRDLYELEHCYRAFADFAAGEHVAVLGHLCAGRDLRAPEVWGPRVLGAICRSVGG